MKNIAGSDTPSVEGFKVGQWYRVPCLKTREALADGFRPTWGGAYIPVTGPLHRDAGVVKFPWLHWHVDLRFLAERILKKISLRSPYSIPLQKHPKYAWMERESLNDSFVEGDVQMRRMKCKREWPQYPRDLAKWIPQLEEECAHLRMKGMVCPHRGIPLQGCPRDGDVVTCPGHGLRWNVKTGEIVRG